MRISPSLKDSFRVYTLELTETSRSLREKARDSPFLYGWFSVIIAFSVVMAARLTEFEMEASLPVDMEQIFLVVFFLFLLKASADFHGHFVTSKKVEYLLATPMKKTSVSWGIFAMIFWVNLGLWTLFSSAYVLLIHIYDVPIGYPELYLQFTLGIMLSSVLGTMVALHYFSPRRWLMIVPVAFISAFWYFHSSMEILLLFITSLVYLWGALRIAPESFGYMVRKERKDSRKGLDWGRSPVESFMWKEMTVLWRERLISSFIFTSVIVGFISGYLSMNTDPEIFPPQIRDTIVPNLPFVFMFLGIFILASYLFVFPALNTFLAEEDTLWLLKNLPARGRDVVAGKSRSLLLALVASLPFPFYFVLYPGMHYVLLATALLIFSFLISVAISLPFGIRYAGKRSDVLLLYSVSVLLFALLSIGSYGLKKGIEAGTSGIPVVLGIFSGSALLLYTSVLISGRMMDGKY